MLYNIEKNRIKYDSDCNWCRNYNKITKSCNGIGSTCFKYNKEAKTYFDPVKNEDIKVDQ